MYECEQVNQDDPDGNVAYEHKPADAGADACYCVQPVLNRLAGLCAGAKHPHGLNTDDVYLERLRPYVTHTCDPYCYKEDEKTLEELEGLGRLGTLKEELEGLDGRMDRPAHSHGVVSLPPLDPRPELRRQVMREAMRKIIDDAQEVIDATIAAQQAYLRRLKEMPGQKLLANAGTLPAEPEPEQDGTISRQRSNRARAVVAILSEGDPGFSRR